VDIHLPHTRYEKNRINLLRLLFLLLAPVIFVSRPFFDDTVTSEISEVLGLLFIISGILGRAWSILYIGGKKNISLITIGPYSMCRHPLYLFSTLAVMGFGLLLQSIVLTVVLTAVFGAALAVNAMKEEARLRAMFGDDYADYARKTPAVLPAIGKFHTDNQVTFDADHLKSNFWDATVFVFLIPLAAIIESVQDAGWIPTVPVY